MPSVLKGKVWVPAKRMFSGLKLGGREEGQSSLGVFSHSQHSLWSSRPLHLPHILFPPTHPSTHLHLGRPVLVDKG